MRHIMQAIINAGGNPLFVGGCVRDRLMGVSSKDIDVEVYGISADRLVSILSRFGKVNTVGVSFGVIKLSCNEGEFDFTLPRRDNKVGKGHKGFIVEVDSSLTPREAAMRRDFTMNSVAEDIAGNLIDPYNGAADIRDGILRATSQHFAEDALRVLRGFQFAGRFNMVVEPNTANMCYSLLSDADSLSQERILGEWLKWATKSTKPSAGLQFLLDTGWLGLYDELAVLVGLPQEPEWHPEGDVWTHTGLVCDEAAQIAKRDGLSQEDTVVLMFAALCHDLGKATTTVLTDGRIKSPGHAEAGVEPAQSLMQRIGFIGDAKLKKIVVKVQKLVQEHMAHIGTINERSVRRLSQRVSPSSIGLLAKLIEADHSGRSPLPKGMPDNAKAMLEVADIVAVKDSMPAPILTGKHLIDLGMQPGPLFGTILKEAYQRQLDGVITSLEDAILYVKPN